MTVAVFPTTSLMFASGNVILVGYAVTTMSQYGAFSSLANDEWTYTLAVPGFLAVTLPLDETVATSAELLLYVIMAYGEFS